MRNRTARRIAIARTGAGASALIVPPFGERLLPADQLPLYDYAPWLSQRLVTLEEVGGPARPPSKKGAFGAASGYSFLASLACLAWGILFEQPWLYAVAFAAVLVTVVFAYCAGWHGDAWRSMARSAHMFVVVLISFGFTLAAVSLVFPEDVPERWANHLALLVVWLFVAVAAFLPAALFFFFHRQKVPTLRANFLRDVVRLDPNVQTVDDAETAYDALLSDVYGSGSARSSPGRGGPVVIATALITALWIWALVPGLESEAGAEDLRSIFLPDRDVVTFAFLGAYVFAVNLLFRRYTRSDLGPKAYTHITVRMLVAVATAWVVSFAPFASTDAGEPNAWLLLLAFMIGIVPETGTAVVQDVLQGWKPVGKAIPSLAEDHPLSRLDGVSLYDRAHLLEVGIENVESLAHHHLVDLMLWTRIPTPRLVDFVDQAVLYLHVRGPVAEGGDDDEARRLLCRHGIRTASDLERAYARAAARSQAEGEALLRLLDGPGAEVSRLRVALDAMEDDEWMVYVRLWREQSSAGDVVSSVEEFVALSRQRAREVRFRTSAAGDDPRAAGAGAVLDLTSGALAEATARTAPPAL